MAHQLKDNLVGWCRRLLLLFLVVLLSACSLFESRGDQEKPSSGDFAITKYSGKTLRIVAGSENRELEPIIRDYANNKKLNITIDYLGSLDIMSQLLTGQLEYDAVWPASSIWLTMGDQHRILKHSQTTSISPVVFGIRQSLAKELGFVDKDVYIDDIIKAIKEDKFKFAMTSATQSNSGASAYLGFLTAIASAEGGLTQDQLQDPQIGQQIKDLLAGVNRSSGSSNWLVDLFLQSDYDAMVNYETLIIQANQKLIEANKEPLHLVYPIDGLAISDSPLAYVDHKDPEMEEKFLDFQSYILSDDAQEKIQATGKRSRYGKVSQANEKVFNKDWGIDINRVISPIRWPKAEVIQEALVLYQTQFKKPALTAYVLDYSGSMNGEGYESMMAALEEVLIPENAAANLLQGTSQDVTLVVPFSSEVFDSLQTQGNDQALSELYQSISQLEVGGGTAMYEGINAALELINQEYGSVLDQYSPAVVVLTDGRPNGAMDYGMLESAYQSHNKDIPIFSILFGDSEEDKMKELANLSKARVFDGRKDLIKAFKQVKGYN